MNFVRARLRRFTDPCHQRVPEAGYDTYADQPLAGTQELHQRRVNVAMGGKIYAGAPHKGHYWQPTGSLRASFSSAGNAIEPLRNGVMLEKP